MTVQVQVNQRKLIGKPLAWDGQSLAMLRRDGRYTFVPVSDESDIKKLSDDFTPYESEVIRRQLQKEFGVNYQVSITRNFVVVHPPGDYQIWAMPFELLYQRFRNYFTSRGFALENPEFPMVAVVLRTRKEFDKFLRIYHNYDSMIVGYYSPRSNRIITYDPSEGRANRKDWAFNETLIHEAAHQTAHNVGIHNRFGAVPRWISEGLALLFEAKGVNNTMNYSTQKDRINKDRLLMLQYYYSKDRIQGQLGEMIRNDNLFERDPSLAYAYAWGITFYLSERQPDQYFEYLRNDAKRESFVELGPQQRLDQFTSIFGEDLSGLENRIERFIMKLDP